MPGRRNMKEEDTQACQSMAHSTGGSMNNLGGPIVSSIEWGRGRKYAWRDRLGTTGERSYVLC